MNSLPRPRITMRPAMNPTRALDVTRALTEAVAREIWSATGGNDVVNWLEAERFVEGLARQLAELEAQAEAAAEAELESKPDTGSMSGRFAGRATALESWADAGDRLSRRAATIADRGREDRSRPAREPEHWTGPIPLL